MDRRYHRELSSLQGSDWSAAAQLIRDPLRKIRRGAVLSDADSCSAFSGNLVSTFHRFAIRLVDTAFPSASPASSSKPERLQLLEFAVVGQLPVKARLLSFQALCELRFYIDLRALQEIGEARTDRHADDRAEGSNASVKAVWSLSLPTR